MPPSPGRSSAAPVLLLVLFLGPAITALAYSTHPTTSNALAAPLNSTHSPKINTIAPKALDPVTPQGFAPSDNRKETLPALSNATLRIPAASGSNDGYCFLGPGFCGQLTFHGGVIMHNASIVIVLWAGCGSSGCLSNSTGYFDNATIDPKASNPNDYAYGTLQFDYMRDFCAAGNPLLRAIQQYADGRGPLGSCSVYGGTWYYDYHRFPEKPLTDADIQTESMAVLNRMNITANVNTAIFMFTPYGIPSCISKTDCFPTGNFCAYHSWFWSGNPYTTPQVVYASMPDDGWAGAACALGGPSPNHDPFADLEVSPFSHETSESFTDPTPGYIFGDGWYYDGFQEIGDECAYDFVGTELADGSNVHLGIPGTTGDAFRIQSEWSNANGGCTLDLRGPPTLFQEVIYQDVASGTPASPQTFPVHFEEAGETGSYSSTRSTCCAVNTTLYATPGSFVSTYPVSNSSERWCFDASCGPQTTYIGGYTVLPLYYFDLLRQSASYKTSGGGSFSAPDLTYETAPSIAAQGDDTLSQTIVLNSTSQEFWPLRGSTVSVPGMLVGGPEERWAARQHSWKVTAADVVNPAVYYHQYALNFSSSIADGGTPGAPELTYVQLGSSQQTFLSNIQATYWLDSGSSYEVTNPLFGSNSTQRWITGTSSGTANGPKATAFVFYHQYYLGVSYNVMDGGAPTAPSLHIEILGVPASLQLTQTPALMWIDANSWSAPAILGSGVTERWATLDETNGAIDSNSPIALLYYHQFTFGMEYFVSDSSSATTPVLTSESFGKSFAQTLSKSAAIYWFDNGAGWSVNRLLNGSTALERWITNTPTGGTVAAPLTSSIEYFHEYYVTIQTAQKAGGYLTPTAWYNATASLQLTANANGGWQFERWDGKGNGAYSGNARNPTITVISPILENATFYPSLVLTSTGAGQVSFKWGVNQGSFGSEAVLYVPLGTNITLSARPASPFFVFDGYTGASNSSNADAFVIVNGPVAIKTNFSPNIALIIGLFGIIGLGGIALVYYLRRTPHQ